MGLFCFLSGIYMGPPPRSPPIQQQTMFSGYNSSQFQGGVMPMQQQQLQQMHNRHPIRDPDYAEEEFNRGIPHTHQYPSNMNMNMNMHSPPPPHGVYNNQYQQQQYAPQQQQNYGGGYDSQFQQMSSNINNNRRMM